METAYDRLEQFLKKKGLRFTKNRRDILAAEMRLKHHYTPEELEAALRKRGSTAHRATIYRLIPFMLQAGIIREVQSHPDGRTRYEHIFGRKHHHHLHCLKCGRIIPVSCQSLEEEQDAVCRKFDFEAVEHCFYVFGYCSKCRTKGNRSKRNG